MTKYIQDFIGLAVEATRTKGANEGWRSRLRVAPFGVVESELYANGELAVYFGYDIDIRTNNELAICLNGDKHISGVFESWGRRSNDQHYAMWTDFDSVQAGVEMGLIKPPLQRYAASCIGQMASLSYNFSRIIRYTDTSKQPPTVLCDVEYVPHPFLPPEYVLRPWMHILQERLKND